MPNIFAEKSAQTWMEGEKCLAQGMANSAANRIYYSVFQAVKGFAIARQKMTMDTSDSVHRVVLQIVGENGGKGVYFRRQLNRLVGLRIVADYKIESVDAEKLKELLADADSIRKHYIRIAGSET
jgi:uncharacterized protein (UPF0332 family)